MTYLAALVVVTPLVALYVCLVRMLDRYEPEPWWALALCFLWGALGATLGGGLTTSLMEQATNAAVFGGQGDPQAVNALSATFYAPLFEEAFKGIGVIVLFVLGHLLFHGFDGPLDGVVYGGTIGLGFTLTEDTLYVGQAGAEHGASGFFALTLLRTVFGGLDHAVFTSMTGLGWGMAVVVRSRLARVLWPCFGFAAAIALHGMHNALPSLYGGTGGLVSVVITWGFLLAWCALVVVLVYGERRIVLRQLAAEVGGLVCDARELSRMGTLLSRSLSNLGLLGARGWRVWQAARRRHRALVQLALTKERRAQGDGSSRLAIRESELRAEIAGLAWIAPGAARPATATR
jgi:RsiW-degrading membrane proteinase PrsW (M82 family)